MGEDLKTMHRLIDRIEADQKKDASIGRAVVLPVIKNAAGALAVYGMFWLGSEFVLDGRDFSGSTYGTVAQNICLILFFALTIMDIWGTNGKILRLVFIGYRLGIRQGKGAAGMGEGRKASRDKVKQPTATKGKELLEDVKAVLEAYYSNGTVISRDSVMDTLRYRDNSRASAEACLKFLENFGLIVKGSKRNDPIEVKFNTYNKAKAHIEKELSK